MCWNGDKLVLRLHLDNPGNQVTEGNLSSELDSVKRLRIIESSSRIDSYELAAQIDVVFVWTSFFGVEWALRNMYVGARGDAASAGCFDSNWINTRSKLQSLTSNPKKTEGNSLLPYANYLAKGNHLILFSQTRLGRFDSLEGLPIDVVKPKIAARWKLAQVIS